jgi:hypothetical protein
MSVPTENETVETAPQQPLLQVVNPDATPEQIAALVAVFAAIGSGEPAPVKKRPSEWSAKTRSVRRSYPHGLGGWKASGLPR